MKRIGKLRMMRSDEIESSGIGIGFECLDREIFDPERCYDKLAEIGVKHARCQTGWLRCEKEKGVYDFDWLDKIVDNLLQRGIKPWFNVSYGNPLYMDGGESNACVGMVPLYYGDETLQAWRQYINALAMHYRDRVSHFEIWNEPEGIDFWQPKAPDPLEYARFIRVTAPLIKDAIPDAKIGACSNFVFYPEYMVPLFRSGIAELLSFYCVHAYRIQPELHYARELRALRKLMDCNGGEHVDIWQGESGYASHFPENHWLGTYVRESEINQAKWLLRRFFTDCYHGAKMTSFFQMVDMTAKPYQKAVNTVQSPARHGILNGNTYTPKMAYNCLGNVAAILDADTKPADLFAKLSLTKAFPKSMRTSRLPDISATVLGFERNGYPLYAYYIPEDVQMEYGKVNGVTLEVLKDECLQNINDPVLVDMLDGEIFSFAPHHDGKHALCFTELPITDYPVIITDRMALENRIA
ncbi:MAG: beta-galactosidase [Planctomycetes bacterium]|nr:beta-galactosidase [Planctomycetota bacterium]